MSKPRDSIEKRRKKMEKKENSYPRREPFQARGEEAKPLQPKPSPAEEIGEEKLTGPRERNRN